MSTAVAADFMKSMAGRTARSDGDADPTLMYDRRQAFSGGYRTLLHMKPLIKTGGSRSDPRAC